MSRSIHRLLSSRAARTGAVCATLLALSLLAAGCSSTPAALADIRYDFGPPKPAASAGTQSAVKVLGGKLPKCRFAHLAEHRMPDGRMLIDSYHCSRYNQNTGRLTAAMFEAVFARALELGPG